MPAWLLPAAASLIGGFFANKGQRDRENQNRQNSLESQRAQQYKQWSAGKGNYDRNEAIRAGRAQLSQQWLKEWFPNSNIDPAVLAKMLNPTAYPEFQFAPDAQEASPGWMETLGGAAQSLAPYIGLSEQMGQGGGGLGQNPTSTAMLEYMRQRYPGTLGVAQGQPGPMPPGGTPQAPITAPGQVALEELWGDQG